MQQLTLGELVFVCISSCDRNPVPQNPPCETGGSFLRVSFPESFTAFLSQHFGDLVWVQVCMGLGRLPGKTRKAHSDSDRGWRHMGVGETRAAAGVDLGELRPEEVGEGMGGEGAGVRGN